MSNPGTDSAAFELFNAALEQPSPEREAFIRLAAGEDVVLRDRALALLAADASLSGALRTGGARADASEEPDLERVGAYRVTGLIGQGGMGAVFAAERDDGGFDHKVAIKVIRQGVLSEALVERFRRERQILAGLSHPNIASLFDGGELPDGSPYIVMEFVDGMPICDYARDRGLGLYNRLWLFNDVCAAVRYAHQNLIVHRDITPSNVLVTRNGQVKLIDFGIAKPNEPSVGTQEPGAPSLAGLSFTPGYAAPERSQGGPANTLSDVYSLGKLLGDLVEDQSAPEDVAAIIRRATAELPPDRYSSVDALMDDLQRFREGYGVAAREGGPLYLVGKFVRRRRLVVAGVTAAIIGLSGALSLVGWQYVRAEHALTKADFRFQQVRTLAKSMMFDVYDKIDLVPGATRAKVELADAAQTYLDSLAADPSASRDLQIETANGLLRLSEIQGQPGFASLKDVDNSERNLQRAAELLAPFENEPDKDADLLRAFGLLKVSQATTEFYVNANADTGLARIREAQEIFRKLAELEPDNSAATFHRLASRGDEAMMLFRENKRDEAIPMIEDVVKDFETALLQYPDDVELLYGLARSYRTKSEILVNSERASDAVVSAASALETMQHIRGVIPAETLSWWRAMQFSHWRRAFALYKSGKPVEAVEDYYAALHFADQAIAVDAEDEDARESRSIYLGEMAYPLLDLKRMGEAEKALLGAMDFFQARYDHDPDRGGYQRNMLVQHVQMHEFYKGWPGHEAERCFHLKKVKAFWDIQEVAGTLMESDRPELESYFEQYPLCAE